MTPLNIDIPRHSIAHTFSQWTALSALKSGSPLKSRDDIYPFVQLSTFETVLKTDQAITQAEFNKWHNDYLERICFDQRLSIGWGAKIVNVYLKSMCYLSEIGRPGLVNHLHPPIDSGLWEGLKKRYRKTYPLIWNKVYSKKRIKEIKTYPEYLLIIEGMREIASLEKCLLIEVERFWEGTSYKTQNGS